MAVASRIGRASGIKEAIAGRATLALSARSIACAARWMQSSEARYGRGIAQPAC
jgi:hypothetical protein